jgi:hypothetical protein
MERYWRFGVRARLAGITVLAVLGALAAVPFATADLVTATPVASLSFDGPLQQSNHSASVRVRCRHSVLCAGHVVLRLIGQSGASAGRTVDTESRYVSVKPGHSQVAVLRYSQRAQDLLHTGNNLTLRITLKPA